MAVEAAALASTTTRTEFFWEHTGESWHLLLFLVLAIAGAIWAWRRYGPAPAGFPGVLARLCRVFAVALLVMLIAGPAWRTTETTIVPGNVLVAIDRSASMARADLPQNQARISAAVDLAHGLAQIAEGHQLIVDYQSIGGVTGTIDAAELARTAPTTPGNTSPLAEDLQRLLATNRPDLLLVVSDGKVTEGAALDALTQRLRSRDMQFVALATGTETAEAKIWIEQVDANKEAALNEKEPIIVHISGRELKPGPVMVRLFSDGQEVAKVEVTPPAGGPDPLLRSFEAQLDAQFTKEGQAKLRVEVGQDELKDARDLSVVVSERKLQVLLLDYRPRYEARYLREALRRDHTITLHSYLFDVGLGRDKKRLWGKEGPDHVPLTSNELRDYDVIIIGDLGPDSFDEASLTALDKAVRENGTGLIWIPGELGATAGFSKHKFGGLLPVNLPDANALSRGYQNGEVHRLNRTEQAARYGLLDASGSEWNQLPPCLGAAAINLDQIHAAEVLMEDQDKRPMVVNREFGAGHSILIAVDDTWRWRRNAGDAYLHRFHSQLLRFAAGGRRNNARPWRLFANPQHAVPGQTVTLSLALSGSGKSETASEGPVVVRLTGPDGVETLHSLLRVPDGNGFSAKVPAPMPGTWRLSVADGPSPSQVQEGDLEVLPPTSEVRDPRADLAGLESLTRATGGQVFHSAEEVIKALPDVRKTRVEVLPPAGLWDNSWTLAVLVGLLAVEWALRRLFRLP